MSYWDGYADGEKAVLADAKEERKEMATELAALRAEVERYREALEFVERWAVYKRYKPKGKSITADEAIGIIAFHPSIQAITKRYEANGEIDQSAYERDRAALSPVTEEKKG